MPESSAFPIIASNEGQVLDRGLTAREMCAAIILSGMYANAQEHVDSVECRCHVCMAVEAAGILLEVTRGA
jgi:hypothetical protein